MRLENGMILKCIGGFYYVRTLDGSLCECKARGVFRKNKIKPVAGDNVALTVSDTGYSIIDQIEERKNLLVRPSVSNVDRLFIVSSISEPRVDTLIIDKLIVIAELLSIEPIIVISKSDLESTEKIEAIYNLSKIKVVSVTNKDPCSIYKLKDFISNGINVFTGNSGVGKSTVLNCLFPNFGLKTQQISKKLNRGKHTTTQTECLETDVNGVYVVDTPGFSSIDILSSVNINKDNLIDGFKDLKKFAEICKFTSCSHLNEVGCGIIEAVKSGDVSLSRYESYANIYNEIKKLKIK